MKSTLIVILTLFQANLSQSQNLYLTASTGYNFGSNRSNFQNYTYNKLVSVFYPFHLDRFAYSLGKGIDFDFGLGYTTRKNIGFELDFSYLHGVKTIGRSQYMPDDIFQKEIWGQFYRINPSVHFICPLKKLSMRMSIGGLLGFGEMHLNQKAIYQGKAWFQYENEFSGGYYLGFKAGIGVLCPLSRRLNLFAEVNYINAYYSPSKARVNKFMSGENDYTHILVPIEREIEYSNSVEAPPYDVNKPYRKLKDRFTSSSIGLQVGIQWSLWQKKEKEEKTD